ncbi:recombination mediator RecR [Candidatus Parcubacteria bacterium]|nr:recombination mediator RecR [Patescibacteria group bacterium]MCG2694380.1 recombination mediator RecR [Candidatus Parcubacteria bacterium]
MYHSLPKEITNLVEQFSRFPGIGEKTALRFVLFLLGKDENYIDALAGQIENIKNLSLCQKCHNITASSSRAEDTGSFCKYCADPARDKGTVCVISSLPELMAIEATGDFLGLYHILGGKIDPLRKTGPEHLRINTLIARIKNDNVREVILAMNSDIPGENTILYLTRILKPLNIPLRQGFEGHVKISRLARGLPMGSELEYADPITLSSALEGRQEL